MILGSLVKSQNYPSSLQLLNNQLSLLVKKHLMLTTSDLELSGEKPKPPPLSIAAKQPTNTMVMTACDLELSGEKPKPPPSLQQISS